jgi:hypothetical protein
MKKTAKPFFINKIVPNFNNMSTKLTYFEREYPRIRGNMYNVFELDVDKYCNKLLSIKKYSDKEKIDGMLELDATMYMNLGSDSTKSEIRETKKKSRIIYRAIKSVDKTLGDSFLSYQDKEL